MPIIQVLERGIILYGREIGSEPTFTEIAEAIPYLPSRRFAKLNNRELIVFDAIGIHVVRDVNLDLAFNLFISFDIPDRRPIESHAPLHLFEGVIRIGSAVFSPPISDADAFNLIKSQVRGFRFFFTYSGPRNVQGLSITFELNEAKMS